jgi:type I restriction-modification system DNA methylase subunit
MSIYQSSVLKKHLAAQDEAQMTEAFEKFSAYFLDASIQENIRNSKEEQFQEGFLRELFVNILGYTINPNPDFNLTTELKNIKDAKKTDGAILKDGAALAVIELKGTDTKDLDKVTDQAFNYKNNQPECVYVVTSNFEKLRFFIYNAVEYVEFNLFTLTLDQFILLWLFLQKDNLLGGIPAKVKEESLLAEEKVTKRLYKDYSAFKNDLWTDMCQHSLEVDPLLLYKKSQKLLDRFLFIFFAEDKGLLPPNSINVIVEQWKKLKELDEYKPLYSRFQKYFGYMNVGFKGKNYEIHAYNGGLFKADQLLDGLTITDEVLEKHVLKLTEYDFETEVDTNILGHIFEHSLNDIENVRAQLAGEEVDKSKTKRKKDGVFYTPKYITKYIVDNTVGKLCEEKKQELGIDEEEFAKDRKGRRKDTLKKLDAQLKAYREWLLQLTICDPACGSGAFLNQALEFLMAEHRYVDELESQLLGYAIVFPDVENHILERNIYGVDINEESVEIARLSLWLRTAKKGRKLTSLSSNIKVGNSLIDDPKVAGELAFNWQEQFPTVFENGGFDVVIGNPPYVRPRQQSLEEKRWLVQHFDSAENQFDLYHLFIEKSEKIRNKEGLVSLILPNAFLANENSKQLRSFIIDSCRIHKIVECGGDVFDDASVEVLIYVFDTKSKESEYWVLDNHAFLFKHKFDSKSFRTNKNYNFTVTLSLESASCFQKIQKVSKPLSDYCDVMSGIKEYQVGKGRPPQTKEDKLEGRFNSCFKKDDTFRKEVRGKHVTRYALNWDNEFVSYGPWIAEPRNPKYFEGERLLMRQIPSPDSLMTCYTRDEYVVDQSAYVIKPIEDSNLNIFAILGLLNSKAVFWYYQNENNEFDNLFPKIKAKEIKSLPIPHISENSKRTLEDLVKKEMQSVSSYQEVTQVFIEFLQSKFPIDKPSKKLQNWPDMDFKGFFAELKKKKVKLSLEEEAEWLTYFNKKKNEANALQAEIDRIDKEIDGMVYELYGLSEDEIAVIEPE